MKPVSLAQLENRIIRPGLEKHLLPLVMYKGNVTVGRAHRMWNLLVAAKEQECEQLADITVRLQLNPEYSHLCGPDKRAQAMGIQGFASRIIDNPLVAAEEPGLLDYCRAIIRHRFKLERVDPVTFHSRNVGAGGWRTLGKKPKKDTGPGNIRATTAPLVYPFLIHDGGRPEHDLLRKIISVCPKGLNPDVKADLCQDLAVGILCGDFTEDDLLKSPREILRRVKKTYPTKYGVVSLDDFVPGTTIKRIDNITADQTFWN